MGMKVKVGPQMTKACRNYYWTLPMNLQMEADMPSKNDNGKLPY